jgi:hypothetical protein
LHEKTWLLLIGITGSQYANQFDHKDKNSDFTSNPISSPLALLKSRAQLADAKACPEGAIVLMGFVKPFKKSKN